MRDAKTFLTWGFRWAVLCGLIAAQALVARDLIAWNFVDLPDTGNAGETISFTAGVTNTGDAAWTRNHFLELRDERGVHLDYASVAAVRAGDSTTAVFSLTLPTQPGSYVYHVSALQHGVAYFGPAIPRAIVVRPTPLRITLALERPAIVIGERMVVRSATGPNEEVAVHGVEVRALGGHWETLAAWNDRGGSVQETEANSNAAGIFELRAFAAREDDEDFSYSARAFLTVNAIAPALTRQPTGAVATVGDTVTLTVTATGSPPTYQWRRDGKDLPGATAASLTLLPAQVAQSGTYTVVVSNAGGSVTSAPAAVAINPLSLPALSVEVSSFAGGSGKRAVALAAAQVGDVVSLGSLSNLAAGAGWRHHVLVRRPAITGATALAPEDGSGFTAEHEAWNKDGWGNPHIDGGSYDARVTGRAAVDLGNREPFMHALATGQVGSTRALDFVLDAPGPWLLRAEILDGAGQLLAASATVTVNVAAPALATEPGNLTYPYGRADRFVGVFWNAGQAHRLWSTWRADHQDAYRATWAVNWKLMWQPSPYFRAVDGGWLRADPAADSPWRPFWSGHQVYALVPDAAAGSLLTHDLTSQAFAEKAALRLMDIGVDFVAVDYTNQFLEEREDVFPAVNNLALAFQAVAPRSQSGQRVRMTAVVPANVGSGDWGGNGGFAPVAIARFNAKLSTLYERYARFESAWFYLEDDDGARKPLLLLWIGGGGEDEADGTLSRAKLDQLRLADGRKLADAFTIRWVGAYLANNARFLTGSNYTVSGTDGRVSGSYANPKMWSYHEDYPSSATLAAGAGAGAVEAITVQPLAAHRDRFGRAWDMNWPAGQGYHYETPATEEAPPLATLGKTWRDSLTVARALNPKFMLTTWAEFGSENDEPRPELSVTIMDNNKFGTHFGDALKQAVRLFKYRAPTAWIDTVATAAGTGAAVALADIDAAALPAVRVEQTIRLQGWVNPNVATTFTGGSVKVYVDDVMRGTATVGGAWNGGTRWYFDLNAVGMSVGSHTIKVLAEDGNGGSALAGVQFRGEAPRNTLPLVIVASSP